MYRLIFILFVIGVLNNFAQEKTIFNDLHISINGTISLTKDLPGHKFSGNGIYHCTYEIGDVTCENRKLHNIKLYENGELLYFLSEAPGADFEISNSGILLFYDHTFHFKGLLTLHFFSKDGRRILSKDFYGANYFSFSESGNKFGLRTPDGIFTIDLLSFEENHFEKGYTFSFDDTGEYLVVASENKITIYKNSEQVIILNNNVLFPRKIVMSGLKSFAAVVDKKKLEVYSLEDGRLIFYDKLEGDYSFRDLKITDEKIIAGIHKRNNELSQGFAKIYSLEKKKSQLIEGDKKVLTKFTPVENLKGDNSNYDPIPWPFFPFDSTRTAWNNYEQHMGAGSGEWSYLHQGYDMITPIGENTFAVKGGVVKTVLTISGAAHWRIAISDSQTAGFSDGWLYAHLIQNTIQFEVGDTVQQHDYLGDIVAWTSDWGHIHFVEIRDSGLVWLYNDNEWGINFNPLLALTPVDDTIPPVIENVFPDSKFGFCINETSIYLDADSLYGEIDIIVKVVDYIGDSEWQQPAFETYYWIKRISDDDIILERTLGQIHNHKYDMYNSGYYEPYAVVLYKRDNLLPAPSWMDTQRGFYHVLTNNNGDSLIHPSDTELAFNTAEYIDGQYRIYVEAFDANGNSDLDSMDVFFKNGITGLDDIYSNLTFDLLQNYPNPFNPITIIRYKIPEAGYISLKIFDILGREVAALVEEEKPAGSYNIEFNALNLSSGIYYYTIKAGEFNQTRKMILLK